MKLVAEEQDRARVLFDILCRHLYQERVVRPGLAHLERLVESTRNLVRERLANEIDIKLTVEQKSKLDELLVVRPGESQSPLQRFKETPPRASGNELLEVLEKIETLRSLALPRLDLGMGHIHPNRAKLLARRARQRTNWVTAQIRSQQRYLLLVCLLDQAMHEYVD